MDAAKTLKDSPVYYVSFPIEQPNVPMYWVSECSIGFGQGHGHSKELMF